MKFEERLYWLVTTFSDKRVKVDDLKRFFLKRYIGFNADDENSKRSCQYQSRNGKEQVAIPNQEKPRPPFF
ncbi:MAG: hypothetical protein H3Z50_03935 [archaeon]|nr:hypothetical protein [archaeon]MCP8306586.1 hypothetical protein [archaeon]